MKIPSISASFVDAPTPDLPTDRVLRLLSPADVRLRTTLSLSHIHRLQQGEQFPPYQSPAPGLYGLYEHVLDAWLASRIAARPGMGPLGERPQLPVWRYSPDAVPLECGILLLRRRDVLARIQCGTTHLYRLVRLPGPHRLPGPVPLGPRSARWVAYEISQWLRAQCPPDCRLPSGDRVAVSASSVSLHVPRDIR